MDSAVFCAAHFCFERKRTMKRIIAIILSISLFAAVAAGCAGATPAATPYPTDASTEMKDYKDTFGDLCKYLSAKGYINALEENKNKSFRDAKSELIGASAGEKFVCTMSGATNVTIELYDFSKPASPDEVYNSVKKDGKFSVLEMDEVNAYLSDNGKYMMVYIDPSVNLNAPDKNSDGYKRFEKVYKDFKEFHK